MKNAHALLVVALATAPALALALTPAQDDGASDGIALAPYQISVTKECDIEGIESFSQTGLALKVGVHVPGKPFLDVVEDKVEVRRFVDSTGRDLAPGMEEGFFNGIGLASRFDDDDMTKGTLEINTATLPARGAKSVTLDATAALLSARDLTDASAAVTFAKGTKFTLGGIDFEISEVEAVDDGWGDAVQQITLQSKKPLTAIQSWTILDAEGNEVEHDDRGSGSFGFAGKMTYSQSLGPHRALDGGTLRVSYYATLEEVAVPLDLEIGLGL